MSISFHCVSLQDDPELLEKYVDTVALFNQQMAFETENKPLDIDILKQGVRGLLANHSYGFYCLALEKNTGKPVGQTMITYEWSDWRAGLFWWIQSVYIIPEYRKKGVFSALYQHILALGKQKAAETGTPVCGVRLYVDKDNIAAQRTYQKIGMSLSHYDMYEYMFE